MRAAHDGDPVYERFQFLMNAPALFNAVATSVELGIFHFLADRTEATFDQIHQHTGLPPHQLRSSSRRSVRPGC